MERNDFNNDVEMTFGRVARVPDARPLTLIGFCGEEHSCGHACKGCYGESEHLPCLEPECREEEQLTKDDVCTVCKASGLGEQPSMKLKCGHIFHADCVREIVRHRWSTQRITFAFMHCPVCKAEIDGVDHIPEVRAELAQMRALRRHIQKEALKEFQYDGFNALNRRDLLAEMRKQE